MQTGIIMLSVIIPTYNRAKYLFRALESLTGQNLGQPAFEVVVIDDGSHDNTQEVVEGFKDQLDINYLKIGHQGVSVAKNFGIQKARGEIIIFFDDDAMAGSDWLKAISRIMKNEDIITGQIRPIKDNIWQYFAPHYEQGEKPAESSVLLEGNCAMRREVFETIGRFDEYLDYGHEGKEFISRAQKKYQVRYYPEVLIYHDYAFGFLNYLDKQKKFGGKMAYLAFKNKQVKNFWDLVLNYKKIKRGDIVKVKALQHHLRTPWLKKILIKIIAKIGAFFHFFGAIRGYFKYAKFSQAKN